MRAAVKGELGNRFRPEFLNRLDEVVVFSSLARAEVEQVAALMIDEVVQRCAADVELTLTFTPALKDAVVTQVRVRVRVRVRARVRVRVRVSVRVS